MLIALGPVKYAYSALANRICIHANTALAGAQHLQRVGRWQMPTALWPQAYAEYILANN